MSVDRPQGLIEGSGQRGEQRRLDQMVSARLDPMLVAAVKEYAKRHGMSLSDVFREAAVQLLQREAAQNVVTFCVDITNETRPGGISHKSYQTDVPMAILRATLRRGCGSRIQDLREGRVHQRILWRGGRVFLACAGPGQGTAAPLRSRGALRSARLATEERTLSWRVLGSGRPLEQPGMLQLRDYARGFPWAAGGAS